MTAENLYLVFALLVLLLFVSMFALGQRFKKDGKPSPLAAVSAALIVAGIFFGNSPFAGFGLLAAGFVLAVTDIVVKARRTGRSGRGDNPMRQGKKRK